MRLNSPNLYSSHEQRYNKTTIFQNFLDVLNAKQYTIYIYNYLIISNVDLNFEIVRSDDPLFPEDSYHPSLDILIHSLHTNHHHNFRSVSISCYNFNKADYLSLYNHLFGCGWSFLTDYRDVNAAVDAFYD